MATTGTTPVSFIVDSQGVVEDHSGASATDTAREFESDREGGESDD